MHKVAVTAIAAERSRYESSKEKPATTSNKKAGAIPSGMFSVVEVLATSHTVSRFNKSAIHTLKSTIVTND